MMSIFAASSDKEWIKKLNEVSRNVGFALESRTDVNIRERLDGFELVLVDVDLLPGPTDKRLTSVYRALNGLPVIAVYSPGRRIRLDDVRKSFIAGARNLSEKPRTLAELERVLTVARDPVPALT